MNNNSNKSKQDKKATALKYDPEQNEAPQVIAKGSQELANQIIQRAQEHDIPIYHDQELVENLIQLDLDEEIPEELYHVVAEVLSFIYQLNDQN
ncbi:MAG: EscU/YscU/HrcU family type III secretion system export apparatus switch protein [Bacillota bacterium]